MLHSIKDEISTWQPPWGLSQRLRLKLSEWKWKLAGVDLPEQMQLELAREFGRTIAP
jgi:hypothetical protein